MGQVIDLVKDKDGVYKPKNDIVKKFNKSIMVESFEDKVDQFFDGAEIGINLIKRFTKLFLKAKL